MSYAANWNPQRGDQTWTAADFHTYQARWYYEQQEQTRNNINNLAMFLVIQAQRFTYDRTMLHPREFMDIVRSPAKVRAALEIDAACRGGRSGHRRENRRLRGSGSRGSYWEAKKD